jgi:hypothetical protein
VDAIVNSPPYADQRHYGVGHGRVTATTGASRK